MNCHLAATLKNLRQSIVVIGYGDIQHSDQAAGPKIAQQIAYWGMPNVEAIAVPELTTELVEQLADADLAIFVDTYPAQADQDLQVNPLTPPTPETTADHWSAPQRLLTETETLYHRHPQAWQVMVPGDNFTEGDALSWRTQHEIENALEQIEWLIKSSKA